LAVVSAFLSITLMKKIPQPLSQPENTHFVKWESYFLDECKKRNLGVNGLFLRECEKYNLLKPVFEGEREIVQYGKKKIKKRFPYYDLLQIPIVAEIRKRIENLSDIESRIEELKKAIKLYERALPLLYDIRYFYQDEISSHFSSGIAPPFNLSDEQLIKFNVDLIGLFEELKNDFKAVDYLKKHKITKKELRELRDKFYIDGHRDDPMVKWYPFLRTIRRIDDNKFKDVQGSVLLAHDYYILAEILTCLYRDAFDDEFIDPESIFDLTGGKWKKGKCANCHKEIKKMNHWEKYCLDCKREMTQTTEESFRCRKCDEVLFRFVESDEAINKVFAGRKKSPENNLELITDVKLDYGRMKIMARCRCGELNMIIREKGWQ
jgi:tetratricopeptide (TPR) repeat protein